MTKNKIIINSVLGSLIWESEKETLKEAVVEKNDSDADLRGANLRGADLRGADLYGADLRGADLYGADLRGADLRGADLYGADLRGADLYGANLRGANLRGANLYGANLRGANLYGADLRGADLYGANLRGANLYGADLRGADLRGADLYGADLRGADLYGADLYGANLRGANLYGADLRGADLYGANLRGANLRGANLWQLPKDYLYQCSRDILSIFSYLTKEVKFLKEKVITGEIDGTQYEGECACLIGTLANGDGGMDQVCQAIPFYDKGTHNAGESWFYNIHKGDTPESNQFSAHVLKLIEMHETGKFYTIDYKPTDEQLKEFEEKRLKMIADNK